MTPNYAGCHFLSITIPVRAKYGRPPGLMNSQLSKPSVT